MSSMLYTDKLNQYRTLKEQKSFKTKNKNSSKILPQKDNLSEINDCYF